MYMVKFINAKINTLVQTTNPQRFKVHLLQQIRGEVADPLLSKVPLVKNPGGYVSCFLVVTRVTEIFTWIVIATLRMIFP